MFFVNGKCEMKEFEKIKVIECRTATYMSAESMSSSTRNNLCNLFYEKSGGMYDDISFIVSPEDGRFVICAFDDRLDACALASILEEPDTLYLDELYVGFSYRGKGYGQKLLEEVRHCAHKMGKDYVTLVVPAKNKNAQRLYEKCGFSYQSNLSNFAFLMCRPVLNSISYQGEFLCDISKRFGIGNMTEGYDSMMKNDTLLDYIGDYNNRFRNDPINFDAMRGACVFLDEFYQCGGKREDLKYFIHKKLDELSGLQRRAYAGTISSGSDELISKSVRYAEEFLRRENSDRVKGEGMMRIEREGKV